MAAIYEITNTLDGTVYVGATINPHKRWNGHKSASRLDTIKASDHIHNAMKKYGIEAFVFAVIAEYDTIDQAFIAEIERIALLKSQGRKLYNIKEGGNGNRGVSEEERLERSRRSRGKPKTAEHRRKISKTLTGRELADEHKANIGTGVKEARSDPELRKHLSVVQKVAQNRTEVRLMKSKSLKTTWQTSEKLRSKRKQTQQVDLTTGEVIATYASAREAERQTGIVQGNISQCARGAIRSAGGYSWRYV